MDLIVNQILVGFRNLVIESSRIVNPLDLVVEEDLVKPIEKKNSAIVYVGMTYHVVCHYVCQIIYND